MNRYKNLSKGIRKTAVAIAIAAAGVGAVVAAAPSAAAPQRAAMLFEQLQKLELSAEQRAALRGIAMSHRDEFRGARASLHAQLVQLAKLDPHAADASGTITQMADQVELAARARAERMLAIQSEVAAVLNPQQREQLATQIRSAQLARSLPQQLPEGGPLKGMVDSLQLSEAQRAQLRDLFAQRQQQAPQRHAALQAQLARFAELDSASADYAQQTASMTEAFVAQARQRVLDAADMQRAVYDILDAQQRAELVTMLENFDPRSFRNQARQARS